MGGQQFLADGVLLDTARLAGVEAFDCAGGQVTVLAGTQWPMLLAFLARAQANDAQRWTIRQKQTGGDHFSVGGSIAANIHGRGLGFAPLVEDIEWIDVVDARGRLQRASRTHNPLLFSCVVGGYGLFGIIVRACLRLVPDCTMRREVELLRIPALGEAFTRAIADGCLYGDFQFAIDPGSDDFLDLGVFSRYRPVDTTPDPDPLAMGSEGFRRLLLLAHVDKPRAFDEYARFYLSTHGQCYRRSTQHGGVYLDDYHDAVDVACGHVGSEMITELFVPRAALPGFFEDARDCLRDAQAEVVYGTVRLVEAEHTTQLPWARSAWACVVLNLHVRHDPEGKAHAARAFRALVDVALAHGGSFYLTYHRWATPEQVERAYPGFRQWLRLKNEMDPAGVFRSDWWMHWQDCLVPGTKALMT
jgi:FAD/FMN-containing dehydrogenase